jgi:hypothetical protein
MAKMATNKQHKDRRINRDSNTKQPRNQKNDSNIIKN